MTDEIVFAVMTKSGKDGIVVRKTSSNAFRYIGAYGAGSGVDWKDLKKELLTTLSRKRGIVIVVETDFWKEI